VSGARRLLLGAVAAGGLALAGATARAADEVRDWNFRVTLDGSPIGEHRFVVRRRGDTWSVESEARFDIRILGIAAYRYRHEARETWQRGCLAALESKTDDDGTPNAVRRRFDGGGCAFTFAYWNPAILTQSQLINAQTGRSEAVRIARVGEGSVAVRGADTAAVRWRIDGPERPIDLWYSPQGDWLGLDSSVAGGRRLSYRLESTPTPRKDSP
jgi:hypothetical protein